MGLQIYVGHLKSAFMTGGILLFGKINISSFYFILFFFSVSELQLYNSFNGDYRIHTKKNKNRNK